MITTEEEYVKRINDSLTKKIQYAEKILEITISQKEIIREEKFEILTELINEKQVQIDEIVKIDNEFEVNFKELKKLLVVNSLEEIKVSEHNGAYDIKIKVGKILNLFGRIKELEKDNHEKINSIFDEVKENIKSVVVTKIANKAYLGKKNIESASYYIDSKK